MNFSMHNIFQFTGWLRFGLRAYARLVMFLLMSVFVLPVAAGIRTNYRLAGEGAFSDAVHWRDTSFYPSDDNDSAVFSARGVCKVLFTGDITNHSAHVRADAAASWDLGGYTYTLSAQGKGAIPANEGLQVGGSSGMSSLCVINGHVSVPDAPFIIGRHARGSGKLVFSGTDAGFRAGSSWLGLSRDLSVLQLDNGARGQLSAIRIGHGGGRRGVLILLGEGTIFNCTWSVTLGSSGHGMALVADGAEWHAREITFGHAVKATDANSAMLKIDNGRVVVEGDFQAGIVSNHIMLTLHSGGTNSMISAGGDIDISSGTTILRVSLADDFSPVSANDVFTLMEANTAGGNAAFKGEFMDAELNTITNGAVLSASNWRTGEEVDFIVNYTDDGCFTLTPANGP